MDEYKPALHALDMRAALIVGLAVACAASPAEAGRGARAVEYLADDATFVLVVDVAHARKTPMFRTALDLVHGKYAWWDELAKAGIELDKVVDTVVIGGEGELAASDHHTVTIVEGRLDKLVAQLEKRGQLAGKHAGTAVWTVDGSELAVIDRRLVVASAGQIAAVIDRMRDKHRKPGALRELLEATAEGTDVFGGIVVDAAQRGQLALALDGEPRWVAISLAAATQLVIELRLELADDAAAAKVRARLASRFADPGMHDQIERGIGKDFSDSITIDQDRTQVRMSATLTSDEVDRVVSLVKLF